ncbi:hypothetical protein [Mesorhizobium sp. M0047]|uniref:hypothetical protein n=1 Tax=Mesorhizobium sp. M0047 TaxID=2956859 RepID=UPI003336F2D9
MPLPTRRTAREPIMVEKHDGISLAEIAPKAKVYWWHDRATFVALFDELCDMAGAVDFA